GHGDFSAALTRHQHRCDLARPYALTLTLSATLLPARATRLTTRLTPKSHQALHALLPACPLLSQNFAHFLQALEQLFFLLAGHFLLGHAVQVLGRGLEIFRAGSLSLHQVASCLRKFAVQLRHLLGAALALLRLPVEAFELPVELVELLLILCAQRVVLLLLLVEQALAFFLERFFLLEQRLVLRLTCFACPFQGSTQPVEL